MTTVAYKDGVLAADTLTTSNNLRECDRVVKIRKIGGLLVGGAGAGAICQRFIEWVAAGMEDESPWEGKDCGNSMIVTPDRKIIVFGENGPWKVERSFYALGSGEQIALGAMAAGASAEEAVRIAMKYDIYTGGDVRCLRLDS